MPLITNLPQNLTKTQVTAPAPDTSPAARMLAGILPPPVPAGRILAGFRMEQRIHADYTVVRCSEGGAPGRGSEDSRISFAMPIFCVHDERQKMMRRENRSRQHDHRGLVTGTLPDEVRRQHAATSLQRKVALRALIQ